LLININKREKEVEKCIFVVDAVEVVDGMAGFYYPSIGPSYCGVKSELSNSLSLSL
jgi:hypothetical protein